MMTSRWIEIPYPALFPLRIPRPNPIKTRNPAPTSNWDSRFPPPFLAQIPNITTKKSQIPHPAKPIGDPLKARSRRLGLPLKATIGADWKIGLQRAEACSMLKFLRTAETILERAGLMAITNGALLLFHGSGSTVSLRGMERTRLTSILRKRWL